MHTGHITQHGKQRVKSKLTSNSPVNPLSVRGRLRECKNPEFVWKLKRDFVMAVVSRAIRYIRVSVKRA